MLQEAKPYTAVGVEDALLPESCQGNTVVEDY